MTQQNEDPRQIHAALFVDFDNIYIGLAQQDSGFADQFAANPGRWLNWLEQQMPFMHPGSGPSGRRILIRKCYLNPQAFAAFRPYFIRSAFEVVDCPPLTTRGKTSTDIHMVMDILDALNHVTYFNEFIILSGDADFTPVLLRLRMHDRTSTVLSVGYVSPAYKAACDYLISQETFIRDALGISYQEEDQEPEIQEEEITQATAGLLDRMATRLYEAAVVPAGIEASELPGVYLEFNDFRQGSRWLGFNSLRRLTEAIVSQNNDLIIVEEDPWRVARADLAEKVSRVSSPAVEGEMDSSIELTRKSIQAAIAEWIKGIVAESKSAVPMAALAQAIPKRFGDHVSSSDWLGAGAFKAMLMQLDLGNLRISSAIPGFVYDPDRHQSPSTVQASERERYARSLSTEPLDSFSLKHPDLAPLARKVHQLTDTPYLMPEHYALLLRELAREINERGYQLTRTSKTVRDRCVERGAPIARSHVNFVLIGIGYTGYRFGQEMPETAGRLGQTLVKNTLNLCQTAQIDLSADEVSKITEWITGALA